MKFPNFCFVTCNPPTPPSGTMIWYDIFQDESILFIAQIIPWHQHNWQITHCAQQSNTGTKGNYCGNNVEFPSLQHKTRQVMHVYIRIKCIVQEFLPHTLLYLATDHDIEANPIHFIQSAVGFTILIFVIPGKSVEGTPVDKIPQ